MKDKLREWIALRLRWLVKQLMRLDLALHKEKQFPSEKDKLKLTEYHAPPLNEELIKIFGEAKLLKMRYEGKAFPVAEVDFILKPLALPVVQRIFLKNLLVQEHLMEKGEFIPVEARRYREEEKRSWAY